MRADSWALDLVCLGRMFAAATCESPLTFALSLPTLDFAAPLLAAGFVAERAQRVVEEGPGSNASVTENGQLFRRLCALPAATPVLLRMTSGKTVHAAFERVEHVGGEPWAVIRFERTTKGAGSDFINKAQAHRVIFVVGLKEEATEKEIGKVAKVRLDLAEAFVASDLALRELLLRSVPECALIGVVKKLSGELCLAKFRAHSRNGSSKTGALQNVVRAANLVGAHDVHQTRLFSLRAKSEQTRQWNPRLAVFCGSSAYLYQAAHFPSAHHAVLLSPTDYNFDAAVHALNEAYFRKSAEISSDEWTVPKGATAMGFRRYSPAAR